MGCHDVKNEKMNGPLRHIVPWCQEQISSGAPHVLVSCVMTNPDQESGQFQHIVTFEANGQKQSIHVPGAELAELPEPLQSKLRVSMMHNQISAAIEGLQEKGIAAKEFGRGPWKMP